MLEPMPQEVLKGKIMATKSLVKKQVKAVRQVETEIMALAENGTEELDPGQLHTVAKSLRDFHICIENALGFIAHNFDQGIPSGEEVHELLLEQMAAGGSSRPPVLDKVLKEELKKYLDFRVDFEKDSSAAEDKSRIKSLVDDLRAVSAAARQQLTDFFEELKKYYGVG